MSRLLFWYASIILLLTAGCNHHQKSEKEETAYWNARVVDPAHALLYKTKEKEPALKLYNSLVQAAGGNTTYIQAARFELIANYYYFFTTDNKRTAAAVDSALAVFHTAELQNTYPRNYVKYLLFGGQIAYRLGEYNKANDYYFKAKKTGDAYLDPCERSAFNYSIAMVLYRQQNFLQSAHYFNQAYRLQATCAPQSPAIVLQQQEIQSNIGLCLLQLEKYDSALVHFDKALHIADLNKDVLGEAAMDKIYGVIYGNKVGVYMAKDRLEEAEKLAIKSIALNARPGYEMNFAQTVQLQLAQLYSRQRRYPSMWQTLQSLRSGLDTLPNPEAELGWRKQMNAYYSVTAKPILELKYFKSFVALRDSVEEEHKQIANADIARQLKDREQELQIGMLKKVRVVSRTFMWIAIAFLTMAVFIIVLLIKISRRTKRNLVTSNLLNEEIIRQKAALQKETALRHKLVTEAVIQAQESERSIIGLELHDNVNQVLTTVKLHNEMVMQGVGDPNTLLKKSSGYLVDCINEIRAISKRLSAPTLGNISLEDSVKDLLASVNINNKVKITQQISGLNCEMLRGDIHLAVYRILQEQLNNVLKHADASELHVALNNDTKILRLLISDNGKGFDTNNKKEGIGLMNMRTRAETLNGSFNLNSAPGNGCR